jgi:hypothetical protein
MDPIDGLAGVACRTDHDGCAAAYAYAAGNRETEDVYSSKSFSALEWLVISIGRRDGGRRGPCGRFGRAVGRLFAWQAPNQLADARLEQLRRMSLLASRCGWEAPPADMAAFLRSGWSEDQLEILIESVAPAGQYDGRLLRKAA